MPTEDDQTYEPANSMHGRRVVYKMQNGDECAVFCAALDDGGFYWSFERAGRKYPLRLSRDGMDAMIALYHDMLWNSPAVPEKTP